MKLYRRLRVFVAAALLLELIVGLGGALTPRAEIFPFASWFLFSLVPGKASEYDLILTSADEQQNIPPVRVSQAGRLIQAPHSIVLFQTIQEFGEAVETHDPHAKKLRQQIEAQFTVPAVHYDLVKETYHPLARWEFNQLLSRVVLHSYIAGEP